MGIPKYKVPSHHTLVNNILDAYGKATRSEVAEGEKWYREAWDYCNYIAEGTKHTPETVAAVASAISPRLSWGNTVRYLPMVISAYDEGLTEVREWPIMAVKYGRREVAKEILSGNHTRVYNGLKVESFFRNIVGDVEPVTVDSWAVKVAHDDLYIGDGPSPASYIDYRCAYQHAAHEADVVPSTMQATTWIHYRNSVTGRVR